MPDNDAHPKVKTILYIGDDDLSALLLERVLRVYGYRIVHKTSGREGIQATERLLPDLILVDMKLPDAASSDIVAQLRGFNHLQAAPLVILTPYQSSFAREALLTTGCNGTITKPLSIQKLPAQIAQFLGDGRLSRQPGDGQGAYLHTYNAQLVEKLAERVRELTEVNQTLIEQERQQSRFFLDLSKQLRIPCAPIKGYVDLLLDDAFGRLHPEQRETLQTIARNIDGLNYLLNNLLDLGELRTNRMILNRELFALHTLCQDMRNRVAYLLRRYDRAQSVTFTCQLDETLPPLYADRNRIRQVMLNLLDNAVKFTSEGEIILAATVRHDQLVISVEDTGCGMSKTELDRVFNDFWHHEIAGAEVGAGIGLFICRALIEAHQGSIWAESRLDRGSIFSFSLPLGTRLDVENTYPLS